MTRKELLVQIYRGGNRKRCLDVIMEGRATWMKSPRIMIMTLLGRKQAGQVLNRPRLGHSGQNERPHIRSVANSENYTYTKGLLRIQMSSSVKKLTD